MDRTGFHENSKKEGTTATGIMASAPLSPSAPLKDASSTTENVETVEHVLTDALTFDENISYGASGLRGIIQSPYVFAAAALASMGGFSFGYDQGVISIINVMDQFHKVFPEAARGFGKGFMTGMLELGAFLGCLFMPWLADTISRKRALALVVIIFNVGAILQTAAVNYEMLVLGRTVGGIVVGTLAMVRRCPTPSLSPAFGPQPAFCQDRKITDDLWTGRSPLHFGNRSSQPPRHAAGA